MDDKYIETPHKTEEEYIYMKRKQALCSEYKLLARTVKRQIRNAKRK